MEEYKTMRETIRKAMQENMNETKEEIDKVVEAVADAVMEAIADNYRSITEVQSIVECARAGIRVQIAYADPEELDFMDPYTVRACW